MTAVVTHDAKAVLKPRAVQTLARGSVRSWKSRSVWSSASDLSALWAVAGTESGAEAHAIQNAGATGEPVPPASALPASLPGNLPRTWNNVSLLPQRPLAACYFCPTVVGFVGASFLLG